MSARQRYDRWSGILFWGLFVTPFAAGLMGALVYAIIPLKLLMFIAAFLGGVGYMVVWAWFCGKMSEPALQEIYRGYERIDERRAQRELDDLP